MTSPRKTILLGAVAAITLTSAASAEGIYGTVLFGYSDQGNPSTAYGSNIAADADFPAEFDNGDGYTGTVGLGYDFGNNFRVEGRIGTHRGEFNDAQTGTGARAGEEYILNGSIESKTLTVEGFYDIPTATAFTPYVKAGLGVSRNSYSARLGGAGVAAFDAFDGAADGYYSGYADQQSTELTWNVGAGASYALSDTVSLVGEYQYVSFGDVSTGQDGFTDGFTTDASAHEVQLGLRVSF